MLRGILEVDSSIWQAHQDLGLCHFRLGEFQQARVMTGYSGHDPKSVTFKRKSRSRSPGTTGHVPPEQPVTFGRNRRSDCRGILTLLRLLMRIDFLSLVKPKRFYPQQPPALGQER
jgi:hypothetical protein